MNGACVRQTDFLEAPAIFRPSTTPRLRRPHKPDVRPARVLRHDEHRLLAGVADSPRRRREAVVGHPLRGGVHVAGAVQDLERSGAAAGEGVGADARPSGLREAEGGRAELEYRYVGVDDGARSISPARRARGSTSRRARRQGTGQVRSHALRGACTG